MRHCAATPLRLALLAALLTACHLDALFGGAGTPASSDHGVTIALSFATQPKDAPPDSVIRPAIQVIAVDSHGRRATSFAGLVSVALDSASQGARLLGTTTQPATAGVATFSDLRIDRPGHYTLTAALGAASPAAESAPFGVP